MRHQSPAETFAMLLILVFMTGVVLAFLRDLFTGRLPSIGVRVSTDRSRRSRRARPDETKAEPAADAALAGAAKRMGISEETLAQWLAEGRMTIQEAR